VRLQLYPRFPILGGWKSNFNIGYNLPTKFYVSTDGKDLHSLNLTYGLPYYDMVARNYTMRVVLPEGANNIKVILIIIDIIFLLYNLGQSPNRC
jgi:oligosaccharyltransferase complex subunit alpha (ribophorin I)